MLRAALGTPGTGRGRISLPSRRNTARSGSAAALFSTQPGTVIALSLPPHPPPAPRLLLLLVADPTVHGRGRSEAHMACWKLGYHVVPWWSADEYKPTYGGLEAFDVFMALDRHGVTGGKRVAVVGSQRPVMSKRWLLPLRPCGVCRPGVGQRSGGACANRGVGQGGCSSVCLFI